MSSDGAGLTDKQQAFVYWYVKLLNATRAAERAGYTGNDATLRVTGSENLANPNVRAAIDQALKRNIISADALLARITSQATYDLAEYTLPDGSIDLDKLRADGMGHILRGAKPGQNGAEYTLVDPQTSQKMLARYHRLLGAHTEIDVHTTATLDAEQMASLTEQLKALRQSDDSTSDDAQ